MFALGRWILATAFIIGCSLGTCLITHGFTVGIVGFWPALTIVFLTWAYLLITALYYLEATLARPPGANIFTISLHCYGHSWAWVSAVIWLFVGYGYLVGLFVVVPHLAVPLLALKGVTLSQWHISVLLFLGVSITLFLGLRLILIVNLGLLALLIWMLGQSYQVGLEHISAHYLHLYQWAFAPIIFPMLITAMYYHYLIPTLASFLHYNKKQLLSSIWTGSILVALLYTVWRMVIASGVSEVNPEALAKLHFQALTYSNLSQVPIVGRWLPPLTLISFVTAGLGMAITSLDFFADLFQWSVEKWKSLKRLFLCALVLIPPYLLSWIPVKYTFRPILYLTDLAGLFISGLLPIFWVWGLRYYLKERSPYTTPGGTITLGVMSAIGCFVFYLLGIEIIYQHSF